MAMNPSNSSNLQQVALQGLTVVSQRYTVFHFNSITAVAAAQSSLSRSNNRVYWQLSCHLLQSPLDTTSICIAICPSACNMLVSATQCQRQPLQTRSDKLSTAWYHISPCTAMQRKISGQICNRRFMRTYVQPNGIHDISQMIGSVKNQCTQPTRAGPGPVLSR